VSSIPRAAPSRSFAAPLQVFTHTAPQALPEDSLDPTVRLPAARLGEALAVGAKRAAGDMLGPLGTATAATLMARDLLVTYALSPEAAVLHGALAGTVAIAGVLVGRAAALGDAPEAGKGAGLDLRGRWSRTLAACRLLWRRGDAVDPTHTLVPAITQRARPGVLASGLRETARTAARGEPTATPPRAASERHAPLKAVLLAAACGARICLCPTGDGPAALASLTLHAAGDLLPSGLPASAAHLGASLGTLVARELAYEKLMELNRPHVQASVQAAAPNLGNATEFSHLAWCSVTRVGPHNAPAKRAPFADAPPPLNLAGLFASNQAGGSGGVPPLLRQARLGARVFLVELCFHDGDLYSCHNTIWRYEPFHKTVAQLRRFLDETPSALVALILSPQGKYDAHTLEESLASAFAQSGIDRYMRMPNGQPISLYGDDLPCEISQGSLVDLGLRAIPLMAGFVESRFDAMTLSGINCETLSWRRVGLGAADKPTLANLFNSFAYPPVSDATNKYLPDLAAACVAALGDRPLTFIGVNEFESIADDAVKIANEITAKKGQPGVPLVMIGA
jgi:hypothetical protein